MRGIHQIRSTSGKMTRAAVSKQAKDYQLYMQITCLEMEKVRRGVERAAAVARVRNIDARLEEVELEKSALLQKLADRGTNLPEQVGQPVAVAAAAPGGFHFQYGR
jgi:hypothetical protein